MEGTQMRLNFEFNDAHVESLNALKQKTGAASMKDLFNNALTMLEWAVDETEQGKEIVATDGKDSRVFVTPLLRQVRMSRAIKDAVEGKGNSMPGMVVLDVEGLTGRERPATNR
jgi:hypothetical protein